MKNKLNSINNIPFVFCLAMLLLNDFYLKTEYHNWLTGKISDFCGLFIFVLFWEAFFPTKKRTIYVLTALLFVIWKSPYSQLFIDFFSQNIYTIHRIVDYTDLMALFVLPIAFYYKPVSSFKLKISPILLVFLSVFSFCATSMLKPFQTFEQPQYLLFKSGVINFKSSKYLNKHEVYELDSFVLIDIKSIRIPEWPSLNDEFHKVQILKDLEHLLLQPSVKAYTPQIKFSNINALLDSLLIDEYTSVILKRSDSITDYLHFKKNRLHGSFKRFSVDNKLMIDGQFKNGIEDSIWIYYNSENEMSSKKYFVGGEMVKTQSFENFEVVSELNFNTRAETIRDKYIHLAILLLLIISLLVKLLLNFKKSEEKDIIQVSHFFKISGSLTLPVLILILSTFFTSFIPDSYPTFFFDNLGVAILIYLISAFLFLIIFYILKLRGQFDWLFYTLLFSLTVVLLKEWIYLKSFMIF